MKSARKNVIVVSVLIVAVTLVLIMKHSGRNDESTSSSTTTVRGEEKSLPRVVDLGRGTCIPCKMMAPILEELKEEYAGRAIIDVIDIGTYPEAARKYRIRVIPTQIFIDAGGEEIHRHEGFMSKEDIIKKLHEMGVG